MPKIENPHFTLKIEFLDGDRFRLPEYENEPSFDDQLYRRREVFAQLRKSQTMIPDALIDVVERMQEQTPIQLCIYKPSETQGLRFRMRADGQTQRDKVPRLAETVSAHNQTGGADTKQVMTASEAMALLLRIQLRELKQAEKSRKSAPVRTLNLVPRSVIAEIAQDLLERCELWCYSPGPLLNSLIRELLNLEHDRQGMSRDAEAKRQAAFIVAQVPTILTRELARVVHVNASTISRWRRSPEFQQMITDCLWVIRTVGLEHLRPRPLDLAR